MNKPSPKCTKWLHNFENQNGLMDYGKIDMAYCAWEACKQEVLKIINDPDNRYWHTVKQEIIDQIENI